MRIIAGEFRGRRLLAPKGQDVRPTTDRMRERLFSILGHGKYPAIDDARVADIYAGTGALGLEALSRGASHVTFVEKARASIDCINENIQTLGVKDRTSIMRSDARAVRAVTAPFDIVFMDPPYRQGLTAPTLKRLKESGWIGQNSVLVCEIASDEAIDLPGDFEILDDRTQGQQRILILGCS